MADKETGFNITVGAEADVNSAKKAVKDVSKAVDSSLKNGYIEVPVEIKVPIKGASKELQKAQEDMIKQWEKMSKMSFSSFEKNNKFTDDLNSRYRKFKRLSSKEGKNNTRQSKWFTEHIGGTLQVHNNKAQIRETKRLEQKANLEKAKLKNTTNKKELTNNKREDAKYIAQLKRGASRAKASAPGSDTNLGIRTPNMNDTYLSRQGLIKNDKLGTYYGENSLMKQGAETEALNRKQPVTRRKVGTKKAAEMIDSAFANGNNKNNISPIEEAKGLSSILRKKILPGLITELNKNTDENKINDITQKISDTIDVISEKSLDAGNLIINDVTATLDKVMKKLGFSVNGKIGGTDAEEGTDQSAKSRDPKLQAILTNLLDKIADKQEAIRQEFIKLEELEKENKKSNGLKEANSFANKLIAESRNNKIAQQQGSERITQAINKDQQSVENQTAYDKIEHDAERVSDAKHNKGMRTSIDAIKHDAGTGFNTDAKADALIDAMKEDAEPNSALANLGTSLKDVMCPCKEVLESILREVQSITKNGVNITGQPIKTEKIQKEETGLVPAISKSLVPVQKGIQNALVPIAGTQKTYYEGKDIYQEQKMQRTLKEDAERPAKGPLGRSMIETTIEDPSKLHGVFSKLIHTTENYEKMLNSTSEEQDKIAAKRIKTFGLVGNPDPTSNGDKISFARRMSLWKGTDKFNDLFKDLKLTEPIAIDTTKVTEALSKALSGKEMFDAQTGGAWRNLIGSMTGYIGMDSLEKSRAQADAVNTIMANIRGAMNKVLNDIQNKESALSDMQANGDIKFNSDGSIMSGTEEAKTLVAQLEESKLVLASILADVGMVDQVVGSTGGKIKKMIKELGFSSPILRENNNILRNINAGLDKNGKALKFQTRTAEVMNYTFQLMARHVGQMIKRFLLMLNPINLIKKAFQDFASYDVKWQRTMNVIKYNLRRIIKPMMEWIAQQIVNIIGLVNALLKGIGKVFNQNWDLFDQSAASAEQMREELEQAANVTASFDELHDIGTESSNNPAMDLMGDIYTPQWDGLYKVFEDIGEFLGNIINAVKDWDFWDWLILAGAALAGYEALKWLISAFTGRNPLETVAKGFSFLEKAVGWAVLIWAMTEFTKVLIEFVNCMKTASWDDICKSLIMLGGAFLELGLSTGTMMAVASALEITLPALLGVAAVVGALTLFTYALGNLIDVIKGCSPDDIKNALGALAVGLGVVAAVVIALVMAISALISTGIGAIAVAAVALIIAAIALLVEAMADLVRAIGENGEGIKLVLEGIAIVAQTVFNGICDTIRATGEVLPGIILAIGQSISTVIHEIGESINSYITTIVEGIRILIESTGNVMVEIINAISNGIQNTITAMAEATSTILQSVAEVITSTFTTVGEVIVNIINAISNGITTVLTPIMEFVDSVMAKIMNLAQVIAHEVGETIRTVVKTTGDVIIGIINSISNLIPNLLNSILNFCRQIGPAIENSANSIMRTITRVVNFMVSAVEYLVNTAVDGVNGVVSAVNNLSQYVGITLPRAHKVSIPRFVPKYEKGTNYVPNDGLAYLHQGEAVIPKKYNQPFTYDNSGVETALETLTQEVEEINNQLSQGIDVHGQFVQKGTDLFAVVQKVSSKVSNTILNNKLYAR